MSERQQNINTKPSHLARIIRSKPFLYSTSATIMGTIAGAAIMGGGQARAESHNPFLDNDNPSHVLQINKVNQSNQLRVNRSEVKGLPQLRTTLSSEVSASDLKGKIGEKLTVTIPEGSNVTTEINKAVEQKIGAKLGPALNWQFTEQIGASGDSLVMPEDEKTYTVSDEALGTIQEANVPVSILENTRPGIPPIGMASTVGCNDTDMKANIKFTEDKTDDPHMSPNPAVIEMTNVGNACDKRIVVRIFKSPEKGPNGTGGLKLETQQEIPSVMQVFEVDPGTTREVKVNFVNTPGDTSDCTEQMDVLGAGRGLTFEQVEELPQTQLYGDLMKDYGFNVNKDCMPTPTPTPSPTPTETSSPTASPTPTPSPTESPTASPTNEATATNTVKPTNTPEATATIPVPTNTPEVPPPPPPVPSPVVTQVIPVAVPHAGFGPDKVDDRNYILWAAFAAAAAGAGSLYLGFKNRFALNAVTEDDDEDNKKNIKKERGQS